MLRRYLAFSDMSHSLFHALLTDHYSNTCNLRSMRITYFYVLRLSLHFFIIAWNGSIYAKHSTISKRMLVKWKKRYKDKFHSRMESPSGNCVRLFHRALINAELRYCVIVSRMQRVTQFRDWTPSCFTKHIFIGCFLAFDFQQFRRRTKLCETLLYDWIFVDPSSTRILGQRDIYSPSNNCN